MELEDLKTRIRVSYAKRRERVEEEIVEIGTAIEDIEMLMVRNRRSYDEQMKRTNAMRKKPINKLRKIIMELEKNAFEVQSRIRLHEQWLKVTRCWIKVYQDVLQRKRDRWKKEVTWMRIRLQAIEASEGFIHAVFGGGPVGLIRDQIKLAGVDLDSLPPIQPLTKDDKVWIGQRRTEIESILTQSSCDRIKQIELQLRTNGLASIELPVDEKPCVQPPCTHPLLMHQSKLEQTLNDEREELRQANQQLQQRLEEDKNLKAEWEKVFEKLRQAYSKSEQDYRKQIDEHNARLQELRTQLQQLHFEEEQRVQNAVMKYLNRRKFIQDLKQEFAFLGVSQLFGRWHRDGYYENRLFNASL